MNTLKLVALLLFVTAQGFGQETESKAEVKTEAGAANPFAKKVHIGFSLNTYFTTITGSTLPKTYFSKPSLGITVRAEYFPLSFVGVGLGLGFQQRGAGITNPDVDNSNGNPDSTYLERLRFNTLEVPITILLRTPKDVIRGVRLSGSVGVVPMSNFKSTQVFHSIADGLHQETDVTANYSNSDMALQFSLGTEINTGGTGILQVHFLYAEGTKNVYQNSAYDGRNKAIGLRLTILF